MREGYKEGRGKESKIMNEQFLVVIMGLRCDHGS